MVQKIIGIDAGHGHIKLGVPDGNGGVAVTSFFSVATRPRQGAFAQSMSILGGTKNLNIVDVDGDVFEVCLDANALPFSTVAERNEGDDFAKRREYAALVRTALTQAGTDEIDVLVLGLPVHLYDKFSRYVVQYFTGHNPCGSKKANVHVNKVVVIPQPLGSLVWGQHTQGHRIQSPAVLTVDCGWGTLDWLVTKTSNKRVDLTRSGGLPGAAAAIFRGVANLLQERYTDRFEALDQIDYAARTGSALYVRGQSVDLAPFMKQISGDIENQVRRIRARVSSTEDLSILLSGGTSWLFARVIQDEFSEIPLIHLEDSRHTNVRGFVLAAQKMQEKTK
jgi:plasmid segregation protein ParM